MLRAVPVLVALGIALPAVARGPEPRRPWRERVAEAQAAFAADPSAFPRFALDPPPTPVISPNERWEVDGLILSWDCESSPSDPDRWDRMWLSLLDAAWDGATPYIYIRASGPSDAGDVSRCQQMLSQHTGRDPTDAVWFNETDDHLLDSIWIRDYGPFFVLDHDLAPSIVDAHYVRYNRTNDDAQPEHFAGWWGVARHEWDFATEGGNFLPNGHGICLVSDTILGLNPQYSTEDMEALYEDYLGCSELIILPPLDDVTGHVDMWITWLDHRTLVVGQYEQGDDPSSHTLIETAVSQQLSGLVDPVTGEEIEIVRIPQPGNSHQSVWRNYTNGIWIDDTFLMPSYEGYENLENEAIDVLEARGVTVVPISADVVITSAGAFHCISKTLPDPDGVPTGDDDDTGDDDTGPGDDDTGDDDTGGPPPDDDDGAGDDDDLRLSGSDCTCRAGSAGMPPAGFVLVLALAAAARLRRSAP